MFLTPFGPVSDEEMKAQMERQAMAVQDFRAGVTALFDELSEEHLRTFSRVMHNFSGMGGKDSARLSSYYEGMATAKLQARFNACSTCGDNHGKEGADFHLRVQEEEDADLGFPNPDDMKVRDVLNPEGEEREQPAPPEMSPEDFENMQKYGLDDVRDEDTLKLLHFKCINCEMIYGSIHDRMLREPGVEGCGGCQHKAKFG